MDRKTFFKILEKYRNGQATEEEQHFLDVYYRLFEKDRDVLKQLTDDDRERLKNRIKQRIDHQRIPKKPVHKPVGYRYYAAAAAVLLMGLVIWLYRPATVVEQDRMVAAQDSIVPGKNTATLLLEDGSEIALSELHKGIIIGDSIKYEDGEVVGSAAGEQMLTLKTPRGGQYALTLPDGTRVWLNAESSLRYPVRFGKEERRVYLEGEAYFDVTEMIVADRNGPDSKVPFRVQTEAQTVDVLGTEFNISAYADDRMIRTTLVEGRVDVSFLNTDNRNEAVSHALEPGQQAIVQGRAIKINNVDVGQFTAWKDGKFVFEEESLENILKMLARWYDVEIVYQGDRSYSTFTGSVSRYEHISEILDKISYTQAVKFEIEGRRVKVM